MEGVVNKECVGRDADAGKAQKNNRSTISSVSLSGCKSISSNKRQTIALRDGINILIGANGVGKSNFVSFFKMLNYMMTGAFQTYIAQNGFANEILFMGSKAMPLMNASLEFIKGKFADVYDFTLVKSINDTLIFSEESIRWKEKTYPLDGSRKESYFVSDDLVYDSEKTIKRILSRLQKDCPICGVCVSAI